MSIVPPEVTPQVPPELPQPQGGFVEFLKEMTALPGRAARWLRDRVTGMSFAACMAWFVFFILAAMVGLFWFVLRHDGDVPWRQTLTLERAVVGALLLLIPLVTYFSVKNWTETVTSEFPDILDAWKRGTASLEDHNIELNATPLFLVIGTTDLKQERSLMAASGLDFVVEAVPPGPAPLHFYATADSVYIILSDASYLSALVHMASSMAPAERPVSAENPIGAAAMNDIAKSTLDPSTFFADREAQANAPALHLPEQSTLRPGGLVYGGDRPVKLSAQEVIDQTNRIRHVAELIRTRRYPLCPINGIMVLIPFKVLDASDDAVREVHRAIRSDLVSLNETLTLQAPTLAMFTGLEYEKGFRELVRRVGPAGTSRQRFGQGMDVRCRATPEELTALAAHACGAFEDWVYTLFREDGALTRPGNTLLHSLLCTVRSRLKDPISQILSQGFGYDDEEDDREMPFGGCYFSATGDKEDQRAFVRGVFDKLSDLQEDLEWTSAAITRSRRAVAMLYAGIGSCVVLSLVLMFFVFRTG
ncbi:MAG: hypothetical protein NXI04_26620 [Planctomycetaceae bacterium]|nr:hypothetical protein [Planctomycetaceae bacterium]